MNKSWTELIENNENENFTPYMKGFIEELIKNTKANNIKWTHKRFPQSSRFYTTYKKLNIELTYLCSPITTRTKRYKYLILIIDEEDMNHQMLAGGHADDIEEDLDNLHTSIVVKNNKYMKDNS